MKNFPNLHKIIYIETILNHSIHLHLLLQKIDASRKDATKISDAKQLFYDLETESENYCLPTNSCDGHKMTVVIMQSKSNIQRSE